MPPLGLSVEQKSEMKVILLYCVHYTIYCFCAKIYVGYTFIQAGENISNTEPNSVPVLQYCPFTTNSECTYYFLVIGEGS